MSDPSIKSFSRPYNSGPDFAADRNDCGPGLFVNPVVVILGLKFIGARNTMCGEYRSPELFFFLSFFCLEDFA